MNSKYYLNGSIGYTLLVKNDIQILILADMHSDLPYCKNTTGVFVSDWFKKKNKSVILLEEVPRSHSILKELWPSSIHTQKLKDEYLKNPDIIKGLDIRPELIPFSLELAFDKETSDVNLKKYLNLIDLFYTLKLTPIQDTLNDIYSLEYLLTNKLGIHYLFLKNKTMQFVDSFKNNLNTPVQDLLKKNNNILEQINTITSEIMEWYSIAKIIQGIKKNNTSFILHAGLAHTTNIIKLLNIYYKYDIIEENGMTDISQLNFNDDDKITGCLPIPNYIEKQFGGSKLFNFFR
jgi:hypothetical protein